MASSAGLKYEHIWLGPIAKARRADERLIHPDNVTEKLSKGFSAEIETVLGPEIARLHKKGAKEISVTELDVSQFQ